ncbi:hypothetical protein [Pedobacter steynii]|uniref:Uncharacterized protein n=1 Tax=Pedobacter steynii TaxID=430522 RepID=A0A1D7QHW3_9SPHI|nr:hypothetical protein [Pedobacter steynii]AOM78257.1 hypothetical protein BFS30_14400 [Pedobacter steynii]
MKKLHIKGRRENYHVYQLTEGVDLFKVEVNESVYEIFKSRSGEWRLLYHSPNSGEIRLKSLGSLVDAEMSKTVR